MTDVVSAIATAISDGFKLLKTVLDTAEVRKMKACIEAGEKYIQVNQEDGEFIGTSAKEKAKLLKHYAKRFFRYN